MSGWKMGYQLWVAPHAGAWIETCVAKGASPALRVAPHAGAWIETKEYGRFFLTSGVAPHAGAWIETVRRVVVEHGTKGRAPRGRVD